MTTTDIRQAARLETLQKIALEVAAKHADAVDREARFPTETVDALKRAGLLSAAVPKELGGDGCTMRELGELCSALAQVCGSSAMVLAMHYVQLGCVVRHAGNSAFFQQFLRDMVRQQWLMASITSEVNTWGDTRSSICALQPQGGRVKLVKEATTGSYCAEADLILVTCRRDEAAGASDQMLLFVTKDQYALTQTTTWDTMGMRGTVSPGFRIECDAPAEQVMPEPYGDIFSCSMVPYSHILWSSLWHGIAAGAHGKASAYVRNLGRKDPGNVPAVARELSDLTVQLEAMRVHWQSAADDFDQAVAQGRDREEYTSVSRALKMSSLKMACSEAAPRIVHGALQILGMLAYKNDSPYSLNREYRDALSASIMISNGRITGKVAALLLVHKP